MNRPHDSLASRPVAESGPPPAIAVVRTVADAASVDVDELEPLEESMPVDALNGIVDDAGVELSFDYAGYEVDLTPEQVAVYAPGAGGGI